MAHSPGGGTAGTPISPQPEVAVEDASNNIVQNDFSSVTLQRPITGPGSLSGTCFGAESYGIVQFSGCSFSSARDLLRPAVDGIPTPRLRSTRSPSGRPRQRSWS